MKKYALDTVQNAVLWAGMRHRPEVHEKMLTTLPSSEGKNAR